MDSVVKFFQITTIIYTARGQEYDCLTPTQEKGQCKLLSECEELIPLLQTDRFTLKKYHLGWVKNEPKVCCPLLTTTTTTTTVSPDLFRVSPTCLTIQGKLKYGSCVPLNSCDLILESFNKEIIGLQYIEEIRRSDALPKPCQCVFRLSPRFAKPKLQDTVTDYRRQTVLRRLHTQWTCIAKMYSLLQVVFVTFVTCIVCGQKDYNADLCYTPTQEEGQCISLDSCDQLKPLITKSRETLKQYHCGWDVKVPKVGSSGGTVPKVCCPSSGTTTPSRKDGTGSSESPLPSDACFTLESKLGSCLPVQSCPHIVKMLATKTAQSLDYFQRSRCMGPEPKVMYVCCDSNMSPSSEVISRDGACPPSALPPNPASQCCGIESYTGNKVIGGTETAIDQYPWLALLEYTRPQLCGGSLISNRYVLTAAHCILNKANKPREVVAVLLGEYNTTNSGSDCVAVAGGGTDCTPGAVRVPVESAIPHPAYNTQKIVQFAHDIALLRLSQMVTFNDFIRPICLPTSDITKAPPMSMRFFVAGWGAVSETRPFSDIKLYTSLPYVNHEQCQSAFNTLKGSLIWEQQICAGGEVDKDTCKGDSGGPLMYENEKIHEVIGVVSFGLLQCGIKKPSVYTKVYDYLTWINDNIKP